MFTFLMFILQFKVCTHPTFIALGFVFIFLAPDKLWSTTIVFGNCAVDSALEHLGTRLARTWSVMHETSTQTKHRLCVTHTLHTCKFKFHMYCVDWTEARKCIKSQARLICCQWYKLQYAVSHADLYFAGTHRLSRTMRTRINWSIGCDDKQGDLFFILWLWASAGNCIEPEWNQSACDLVLFY